MSGHQLVETVLEFIITERKARSFYCFNWQLSLDSSLREFGDGDWGRCECVCVCMRVQTYVHKGRWKKPRCLRGWRSPGSEEAAVCVQEGTTGSCPGPPVVHVKQRIGEPGGSVSGERRMLFNCVCAHVEVKMETHG